MSSAELLHLTLREAVDKCLKLYLLEKPYVNVGHFNDEEVRLQFVSLLYETARCLSEHAGFCRISRCGRHFTNAQNVADVLMDASNGERMEEDFSESARLLVWNGSLEKAADSAVARAFSPCQHVEIAYSKFIFKEKIPDLLYAFCRTFDRGPANAFLAVSNFLNSVLDALNFNEQFHLDLLFFLSTGKLPTWPPFSEQQTLSLDALSLAADSQ